MRVNKSIKIFFNFFLGPLLGIWLFYSLYHQIKMQPHLHESIDLIKNMPFGIQAWMFWSVIILSFANWGIEARKWQLMMFQLQPIKYWIAFKAVLSGVTFSLNTPNRIGEYGGRILFVKEGSRLKAISLSIAGSICQLAVTLFMGCGGLVYLIYFSDFSHGLILGLSPLLMKVFLALAIASSFIVMLFLLKLSWIIQLAEKIKWLSGIVKYIKVLDNFSSGLLFKLLLLSFFRYLIFVIQYLFLIKVLQVETTWNQGFWIISLIFLVMAIIPSIAIAELGIRGKFSAALFGLYSANTVGILGASFGIWLINLFIPAFAGSFFIIGHTFFQRRKEWNETNR